MLYSELASRYANALFDLSVEENCSENVFTNMRNLNELFSGDEGILEFLSSPIVKPSDKVESLKNACKDSGLHEVTEKFILTLAKKNRISLFSQVVKAFEARSDEKNGVTRGTVVSSCVLAPEERKEIEEIVEKVTKKKVILSYEEDPDHIGGLIATVGSYTFDDTLTSHLRRLQEDIKRRAH